MLAFVLALTTAAAAQTATTATADAVAKDVQRKYDAVRDFSADFVHSYRGGVLNQQATERGHLLVKKPGKMRWEYAAPEKKTFVCDGHEFYSYIPQDKQVLVSPVPPDDAAPTPALFLTGKGNIARDFTVAYDTVPESPADSVVLRLTPRTHQADYESLTLVLRPGTLDLSMLVTIDPQGGRSVFTFTNLKQNVGLTDDLFVFHIPRGVDVVH